MSAALPNCVVCLSPYVNDVKRLLTQGTSMKAIVRSLKSRRANGILRGRYAAADVAAISYDQMKEHASQCVVTATSYIAAQDIKTPGGPPPISVSAAELADPKRRLDLLREALAQRIGDLSADKLYAMYMAELKLQTAQAERDAKVGADVPPPTPDEDGLGDAIAQAAGHLPDLRVVAGGRREVARR